MIDQDHEAEQLELDDLGPADDELVDQEPPPEDRSAPVTGPVPGCAVSFFLDNKRHHGICLAVIGEELLIEHRGPARCFLFTGKVEQIIPRIRAGVASATIVVGKLKGFRYRSVPKKWLWKLVTTGQAWKGIERGGGTAPSPADLLKGDDQMELF
jgi:hypothetical protein